MNFFNTATKAPLSLWVIVLSAMFTSCGMTQFQGGTTQGVQTSPPLKFVESKIETEYYQSGVGAYRDAAGVYINNEDPKGLKRDFSSAVDPLEDGVIDGQELQQTTVSPTTPLYQIDLDGMPDGTTVTHSKPFAVPVNVTGASLIATSSLSCDGLTSPQPATLGDLRGMAGCFAMLYKLENENESYCVRTPVYCIEPVEVIQVKEKIIDIQ